MIDDDDDDDDDSDDSDDDDEDDDDSDDDDDYHISSQCGSCTTIACTLVFVVAWVAFQVPSRTCVDMGAPAIAELAKHPRIVGLKDVGVNMCGCRPRFCVFCTNKKVYVSNNTPETNGLCWAAGAYMSI